MALQQFGWGNRDRVNPVTRAKFQRLSWLAVILIVGTTSSFATSISINLSLPLAHVGASYAGSAAASGGTAPYHYNYEGSLPPGLTINSSTGAITGVPTVVGSTNFKVVVKDSAGIMQKRPAQINVLYPSDSGSGGTKTSVGITISPTSFALSSAQTKQFSASVSGTTNTAVTWSASAGTISNGGMFTAPSVASNTGVTVTATSVADNTKKASAAVTVTASAPVVISVTVSPSSATLASGGSQQFNASVQGSSNTAVTWSASAGTISSGGMFTAPSVSAGTSVSVTATSSADNTKKASATVSVSAPVAGLSIATSSLPGAQAGSSYSSALQASGGTSPYQWTISSGSLPTGFSFSSSGVLSGTTSQTGQFPFSVQVTDASNSTSSKAFSIGVAAVSTPPTSGGNYDGPAELPRIYLQTALANTPAPGSTTLVPAGGSLQNAINSANCGDTIQLAAGAVFSGIVNFPAKACDDQHWIIVRTSAPDSALPPEGSRMLPCYAGVSSLPGRPAFSCPAVRNVLAQIIDPVPSNGNSGPINFATGANHYRLLGLEITRTPGTGPNYRLVSAQSTADHIILDRVWLHGSAQDDNATGVGLNGMSYVALIDSYASDFHCTSVTGVCTDAKVVGGGTSQTQDGPYKVTNNFLEASGENILFGGGAASYTPADMEIRGNHFFKPLIWMQGQSGFVGGTSGNAFVVKNHMELKNAQRVLVEGNIFEYSWGGFSQNGFSIVLTPKNQAVGTSNVCPICAVTDVTIRYNKISHVASAVGMANVSSDNGGIAAAGGRYSIHDLTADDISAGAYNGGGGVFQIFNGWPTNPLNSIAISHVTAFPDSISRFIAISNNLTNPPMYGFTMTNSIIGQNKYDIWNAGGSTSCATSNQPLTVLNACFPGGYTFNDNAIVSGSSYFALASWPTGNYYPASATAIQFVNFNSGNGGDYHLSASSPYKNAASDGKDLGADIDAILTATANSN